jgi:hypothetical protein
MKIPFFIGDKTKPNVTPANNNDVLSKKAVIFFIKATPFL